jgi:diaminopimelate epimerase
MKLHFTKYQATGNDFVLLDNRNGAIKLSTADVQRICNRRFGIGADGLMMIEKDPRLDFNLVYYNSDGTQSLCGNGSRAAMKMASSLGIVNGKGSFNAYDGEHHGEILDNDIVKVRMNDVAGIQSIGDDLFINTGSPHLIRFVTDLKNFPVFEEGKKIRYSDAYKPGGTNANFVELLEGNKIYVRTYERGVENETLSCGTGVTAAALAVHLKGYRSPVAIKTQGGDLSVQFSAQSGQSGTFRDIFLIGPAKMVFEGDLEL